MPWVFLGEDWKVYGQRDGGVFCLEWRTSEGEGVVCGGGRR